MPIYYCANNKQEGEFHHIQMEAEGRADAKKVVTRRGYWLATKPG
jgi:hypothetical protein